MKAAVEEKPFPWKESEPSGEAWLWRQPKVSLLESGREQLQKGLATQFDKVYQARQSLLSGAASLTEEQLRSVVCAEVGEEWGYPAEEVLRAITQRELWQFQQQARCIFLSL